MEALKLASQAADDSVKALVLAREQVGKIPPPPVPDPRDDVNAQRLLEAASTWAQRLNPLRSRWPELHKIDERLAQLDQQQQQTSDTLAALHERRERAPREHESAPADWLAGGQKGARPEPEAARLDEELEAAQATTRPSTGSANGCSPSASSS